MMKVNILFLSLLVFVFLPMEVHAVDPYEAFSVVRMQKQAAPEFTLPQVNGKSVRLADFKDKVVLLGFFQTF